MNHFICIVVMLTVPFIAECFMGQDWESAFNLAIGYVGGYWIYYEINIKN